MKKSAGKNVNDDSPLPFEFPPKLAFPTSSLSDSEQPDKGQVAKKLSRKGMRALRKWRMDIMEGWRVLRTPPEMPGFSDILRKFKIPDAEELLARVTLSFAAFSHIPSSVIDAQRRQQEKNPSAPASSSVLFSELGKQLRQGDPRLIEAIHYRGIMLAGIEQQLRKGNPEPFFHVLTNDPTILTDPAIYTLTIDTWWRQKFFDTSEGKQAREYLHKIGSMLADPRGRPELPAEEQEAIIADCNKWRTICEELKKTFKGNKKVEGLWQQSKYESSAWHRKEARGLLAEEHGISVKEVETIERLLRNGSTPTEAMLQMVALNHVKRGVKTIEKIWGEYLDEHPEKRRKKKRTP